MKKRIFAIISCIIILSVFTLSTFAELDSEPERIGQFPIRLDSEFNVGPTTDFTTRYKLVVNPDYQGNVVNGYTDYNIYDIQQSGVGQFPEANLQLLGLIQHFKPTYTDGNLSSSFMVMLADNIQLTFGVEGTTIYAYFAVLNNQGTIIKTQLLFDAMSQDNDLCIYMDANAVLSMYVYNKYTGNVVKSSTLNIQLYGIIYPSNVYPFAQPDDIENALNTGYQNGKQDGIIIGSAIKQEELDREYQKGYQKGEDDGYTEGLRVGRTEGDGSYQQGYNDGIVVGQDMVEGLDSMYTDFFNGILGFLMPFMDMGIGSLTVFSLVSIVVLTFVIMLIIKIIRG